MLWILLTACLAVVNGNEDLFTTPFSWKTVDYKFPNENVRKEYIANGEFIPENNMPLGLQIWKEKLFITVPRWKKGVVTNLNYILKDDKNTSPVLIPYPDWETNNMNSSDGIVSIFRVRVDGCGRLWGVDTGVDDILGESIVVKPPRVIAIDLQTHKIVHTYTLKPSDQKPESFFADLVVDVNPNNCDDLYVYISDLGGYGLVVYSLQLNDSWRIEHNFMHFDPLNGNYNVDHINFQWTDGIFGMSLSRIHEDGYRVLYFHAMSGITEFSVSTKVLKHDALKGPPNYYSFHNEGTKGPNTQGPSSIIDLSTGIDYFTQVNRNGIACWDTHVKLTPKTFLLVAQNNKTMIFLNDLDIDSNGSRLWTLADNLSKLQYSSYDVDIYNFFINVANLPELTALCKARHE